MPAVVEIVWWWVACVGIWLLTLSSVTVPDLVAAAACALPCGVAAWAGRRSLGCRWRPRAHWLTWMVPLVPAILADQARVLLAVARCLRRGGEPGEIRRVPLPAHEPADVASARRAIAAITVSATPGTFVIDADPEEDELVIHALVSGWPHLDQEVTR